MKSNLVAGMVGVGYWGRNVLRNLALARRCTVKYICDLDEAALARQSRLYPQATAINDYQTLLADPEVDAVVIATAATSHFELASAALARGKHVFVEKPMTVRAADSIKLVAQATAAGKKLMVGHLLEHHPAFAALQRMAAEGEIGSIYYMYTQRVNLGVVRHDESAWWSLAPHDISVICRLFEADPISVSAVGQSYLQKGIEDVVFATLRFADGRMGHIHVSWLDPHKIRKMTIVGTRKMVTWDDMSAGEKIWIYDKGAAVAPAVETYADAITLRTGDIVIPKIPASEPLNQEIQHFIDCILDNKPILTDGADGLRVVRVLEAGQRSLEQGGRMIDPQQVN
ncbi:MAG TPA: Gfo/Idh/MocA family oxidoreductase [Phycisphaerae bacterium]|jgi:predicted dehydrogenase